MKKNASLLVIFLVVLIDLIGFGIVIPILPYYAQEYGASGIWIGWIMTSYSLMQFLFAPFWGKLSDRIGRRPILLVSILGTGFALFALGSVSSLIGILIARTLAGICGANISTAYAYVSDITSEENRSKGMGIIGAGFGLGFIFGPVIGGLLSTYGYGVPMYFAAILCGVNFVVAYFILGEPLASADARASSRSSRPGLGGIKEVLSSRQIALPILLFFLFILGVTQMEVVFAIYVKAQYGYTAKQAGLLFAGIGIVMAFIQGTSISKIHKKFGILNVISIGSILFGGGLFAFALIQNEHIAIVALFVLALGHALLHPSFSTLTSLAADPKKRGLTMGVFHSFSSLARVVGPPSAGFLYDKVNASAPFYSGAILAGSVLILGIIYKKDFKA